MKVKITIAGDECDAFLKKAFGNMFTGLEIEDIQYYPSARRIEIEGTQANPFQEIPGPEFIPHEED